LEERLQNLAELKENPTIVLRIDQNLSIQDLVNVLQIGNQLKVKMVLATENSKK
jgi:biopolymer transport protein ExbD